MNLTIDTVDVASSAGPAIRCAVLRPKGVPGRRYPRVLAYSDTFKLTPPHATRGLLARGGTTADHHSREAGRPKANPTSEAAGTIFHVRLYDAEHTFMRDEAARHEPVATDRAFTAMLQTFEAGC